MAFVLSAQSGAVHFIGKLFSYPYGSLNFDAESVFCAKDGDPILP